MKQSELSNEEISKLFAFVKSKYVYFIDVQHELVDHLACEIEELQTADKNISFDKALKDIYKKYPITGFSNLKEAKVKAMNKYWMHIYWNYFKEYITLPKIVISFALLFVYFKLFSSFSNAAIIPVFILLFVFSIHSSIRLNKRFNSKKNNHYLVITSFLGLFSTANFSLMYIGIQIFESSKCDNQYWVLLISIIALYSSISLPILYNYLPDRLYSDIKNKYPYIKLN